MLVSEFLSKTRFNRQRRTEFIHLVQRAKWVENTGDFTWLYGASVKAVKIRWGNMNLPL